MRTTKKKTTKKPRATPKAAGRAAAQDRSMIEQHHAVMLIVDPADGTIVDANPAAAGFYGWTRGQLRAMRVSDINTLPPDALRKDFARAMLEQQDVFHMQHRLADGGVRDVDVYSGPATIDGRALLLSIVHDQTDQRRYKHALERMNSLYNMLSQSNELIARAQSREALFDGICEIAVRNAGFLFAWIGFVDGDGVVQPVARAGDDEGYIDTVRATVKSNAHGRGPTGIAAGSGEAVVVDDFLADPRTAPWHDNAARAGVAASAAIPFLDAAGATGVLSLYAGETQFFTASVLATLREMALDISFGLESLASEGERTALLATLETAEARWRYALEGAGHGVWEWNPQTGKMFYSRQGLAMLGYGEGEIDDTLAKWETRVHPSDLAATNAELQRHLSGAAPMYRSEHRVRCKDGSYKWIADQGKVMSRAADGGPLLVIGTHTDITERKAAEAALRESDTRYRQLFDAHPEAVWLYDAETLRFIAVNEAAVARYGYSRDEFLAMTIADIRPEEDVARLRADSGQLPGEGTHQSGLWRHRKKDGTVIEVDITSHPLSFGGRTVRSVLAHDVTEERRAQAALRDAEERLRYALGAARQGMFDLDLQTGEAIVNAEYATMLGYDPAEFKESHAAWLERLHPEERDAVQRAFDDYVAGRRPDYRVEFRQRTGNGGWKWIMALGSVVSRTSDGHPARMLGTHTDIDDRKEAEASLRVQSAALNAAADAIVITDRDGRIVWVNPAFVALSGYTAEEAIGRNSRELVRSGKHDAAFYQQFWATLIAGKVWHGEMTNRRKDGSHYVEDLTVTPVKNESSEITHFIAVKRDLTADRELRAQYLQAQKMESVGRLAAGVAHDFNNLLTVINSTADLSLMALPAGDPLRADFEEIHAAGDRATRLTGQLLAFSRKQILKPEVLNLGTLVSRMQPMLQRMIGEDIDLAVLGARDAGSVLADSGQIEQVIMNLAVNARDAMSMGGTLSIETQNVELGGDSVAVHPAAKPGSYVMLSVTDTGVGMDVATRQHLFEPFFTTKDLGKGTGLGLATVYGIIEQSGGTIRVESKPGRGSTFTIHLPRADASSTGDVAARPSGMTYGTETILVVEDEIALRKLASRILRAAGYTVLTAANGGDALRILGNHAGPVDLMLTDVVMPGMSGQDLATRVTSSGRKLKILFTSGYTDDAIVRHGVFDRHTQFLGKPYTVRDLTAKVREVLDAGAPTGG